MKTVGIIMECNPFHEGHAYILKEARRQTGADYCIAVMSGDYVQRGEPVVYDKYLRAARILEAGADLVLELPLYTACGSADYFARGGIALLDRLGVVTDLCFGSESGDTEALQRYARLLSRLDQPTAGPQHLSRPDQLAADQQRRQPDLPAQEPCRDPSALFRRHLQKGLKSGLPFPAARSEALKAAAVEISGDHSGHRGLRNLCDAPDYRDLPGFCDPPDLRDLPGFVDPPDLHDLPDLHDFHGLPSVPNDLLAVEYCRALLLADSAIRPHAVRRIRVPSASERRRDLLGDRNRDLLPETARETGAPASGQATGTPGPVPPASGPARGLAIDTLAGSGGQIPLFPVGPDDFSAQLLYALRMQEDGLDAFADVSGDLADRIRKLLPRYRSYTSFCDLLKTRNVTRTRISRALLHVLLQIRKDRLDLLQAEGLALYARPLALRRSAAPLLHSIQANAGIPFLPRLAAAKKLLPPTAFSFLEEEIRAEELYALTLFAVWGGAAGSVPGRPFSASRRMAAAGQTPRAAQRRIFVL